MFFHPKAIFGYQVAVITIFGDYPQMNDQIREIRQKKMFVEGFEITGKSLR